VFTLPKHFWPGVLGSALFQLRAGEYTPSINQAFTVKLLSSIFIDSVCKQIICRINFATSALSRLFVG